MKKQFLASILSLSMIFTSSQMIAFSVNANEKIHNAKFNELFYEDITEGLQLNEQNMLSENTESDSSDEIVEDTVTKVAEINGEYYSSLSEAISAAYDGDIICLLSDVNESITLNKAIEVDGKNQYTICGQTILKSGTLKNVTLTTNIQKFLTIGSNEQTKIKMENVTIKYPVKEIRATGLTSIFAGNNAEITIENCLFTNEATNIGDGYSAEEWSYGLYTENQSTNGKVFFIRSKFEGAFRTMLPNIDGNFEIIDSTFINTIASTNGSGGSTCITTSNSESHNFTIKGNTFDNAGSFYFQKTENAQVTDNIFKFDKFENYIQTKDTANHELNLTDNEFEMGDNCIVSVDVDKAPIIYPAGDRAFNYWAWAKTPQDSRPADYRSYVYAYNEDGSKTFYPQSDAALDAFLNPYVGNISPKSNDVVQINQELTLSQNSTIPENVTLVINDNAKLTIPDGVKLENSGIIVNQHKIDVIGIFENTGSASIKSSVIFNVSQQEAQITVFDSSDMEVQVSNSGVYYLADGDYKYTVSLSGYYQVNGDFTVLGSSQQILVELKKIPTSSSTTTTKYSIKKPSDIKNGSLVVNKYSAEKGSTVSITATPDIGYKIDKLAVYTSEGNEITLVNNGDGKFTFQMPNGNVSIEVSFKEIPKADFIDVKPDTWYADAVEYVFENSMMNGTSDNEFSPNQTTTRGMIVTILYRLENEPEVYGVTSFIDVTDDKYYSDAIKWAAQNGIISGVTNTEFAPDNYITREQMAVILYRYSKFKGYDISNSADISSYKDAANIGEYAYAAMSWANATGLITGTSINELKPSGNAVRAQVATILMRFCENIVK